MTLFAVCWEQVWPLLWVMWLLHGLFQWLIVFTRVNTGVSGVLAAESCPPEGGTPPPPHHDAPICRISAGPWFPGSSFLIPFFCILCFTKYYFRSLTPRDSLLGASHFFAKLTAWMSDWRPWKVENPWCRQVVLRVLHTCTSSFCTLFPAGDSSITHALKSVWCLCSETVGAAMNPKCNQTTVGGISGWNKCGLSEGPVSDSVTSWPWPLPVGLTRVNLPVPQPSNLCPKL